jgi:hypothetical protein
MCQLSKKARLERLHLSATDGEAPKQRGLRELSLENGSAWFRARELRRIGKWRTKDGKFDIDSSGVLPDGRSFNGPGQLRSALMAQMPQFAQNVVEKMMIYALGRGLQRYDRIVAKEIARELAPSELSVPKYHLRSSR